MCSVAQSVARTPVEYFLKQVRGRLEGRQGRRCSPPGLGGRGKGPGKGHSHGLRGAVKDVREQKKKWYLTELENRL